jgi:hypothetical protein
MAKYPKEKEQKDLQEDNKVHESKSPEQILKELVDAYTKDKTLKKPVPSISQFEQGKFRRKTQPYQGDKPEEAKKAEKVQKNIGLPLMTAEKAEDKKYPKKLGAKNVEAHMKRLKQAPSKYPGGKKQAVAIGLSQARAGEKEPMPKTQMEKTGEMPKGAAAPKQPKAPLAPVMPSKKPAGAAEKQAQASAQGKQMAPKMPKPSMPQKQAALPTATKSEEMKKAKSDKMLTGQAKQQGWHDKDVSSMLHLERKAGRPYLQKLRQRLKLKTPTSEQPTKLAASEEKIVKNQFLITESELSNKCTDCGKPQFTLIKKEHQFTPCICFASENQGKEAFVKLVKNDSGMKLMFNSKADPDSVKAFLLTLKLGLLAKKISK